VKNGSNTAFPIGTHVFSQTQFNLPTGGGLQEYTVINGDYAGVVPSGISDMEAALYPINAMTSALAMFSSAGFNLPFPETVEAKSFDYGSRKLVIIGGGTNTGKLAIQFAKLAGFGTTIAIASLSSGKLLKSFGATHVIARQDADIADQVRRIVGDELLYVYDTFSFGDHTLGISLLSDSKKVVLRISFEAKQTKLCY
jgi:NADPH2:quinone reductase